jgi:hypothetical protein
MYSVIYEIMSLWLPDMCTYSWTNLSTLSMAPASHLTIDSMSSLTIWNPSFLKTLLFLSSISSSSWLTWHSKSSSFAPSANYCSYSGSCADRLAYAQSNALLQPFALYHCQGWSPSIPQSEKSLAIFFLGRESGILSTQWYTSCNSSSSKLGALMINNCSLNN